MDKPSEDVRILASALSGGGIPLDAIIQFILKDRESNQNESPRE